MCNVSLAPAGFTIMVRYWYRAAVCLIRAVSYRHTGALSLASSPIPLMISA